jgi:hypothetical protein
MTAAASKLGDWLLKASAHQRQKSLDDKGFAEETLVFEAIAKFQRSASDRLGRLIEALAPELEAARQNPPKGGGKEGQGEPQPKGGIMAQDGIPPVAQLKALKAEQLNVNARTKEFAEQHSDFNKLSEAQRNELEAIHAEQDRLLQLFRELMAPSGSPLTPDSSPQRGDGGNKKGVPDRQ